MYQMADMSHRRFRLLVYLKLSNYFCDVV